MWLPSPGMLEGKSEQRYEVFNIGTGHPVSVLELVNTFEKVNGLKLNYKNRSAQSRRRRGRMGRHVKGGKGSWLACRKRALRDTALGMALGEARQRNITYFYEPSAFYTEKIWRGGNFVYLWDDILNIKKNATITN